MVMAQKRQGKKTAKLRGSRTHGYGSHKKHRGGGSRGGRGMAGVKRQKKTWLLKHKPGHLGKSGFKSLKQRKLQPSDRVINVRDLAKLAAGNKEVDLAKLGYDKVLGGGSISVALTVKAGYFTESAKQKIEKANGKAVPASGGSEAGAKVPKEAGEAKGEK
jgi:large subunit ribosomal protein L15